MTGSRFARWRAVLLLTAFCLSLAGQAVAATVVAHQGLPAMPKPMMVTDAAGVVSCPDCDQANGTGTVPNCAVAFCWGLATIPAQAVRIELVSAVIFTPLPYTLPHGIAVQPEPHPPRAFLPS